MGVKTEYPFETIIRGKNRILCMTSGIFIGLISIGRYLIRLSSEARKRIVYLENGKYYYREKLDPNIVLEHSLSGYFLFVLVCIVSAILIKQYFDSEAKSSYLLKRLPVKHGYRNTILKYPLFSAVVGFAITVVLGIIFILTTRCSRTGLVDNEITIDIFKMLF